MVEKRELVENSFSVLSEDKLGRKVVMKRQSTKQDSRRGLTSL